MRWTAALTAFATMSATIAAADPAHDLFTGQNMSTADGRISRFACHNCHGRDGRGGIEGDVPEIAGSALLEPTEQRPAYDFAGFRDALTAGAAPSGRALSRIMPRYDLTEAELVLLWQYLQDLPSRQAMGVEPSRVRFGVVIDPTYPELGLRYLRSFRAEIDRLLASGTVYGRRIEVVALSDPLDQTGEVIAALAMPPGHAGLTAQLTALGLPVIFPLTALTGTEDSSIQRSLMPTDRDINGAIAQHLAATSARRIGISAEPARMQALSYLIRLALPEAEVGPVETFALTGSEAPDAVVDLTGQLPKGLSEPKILYRLASLAAGAPAAQNSFLVIEAPDLINRALDDGLHPLEAHSVMAARILTKAMIETGRDLSRSRLLSALKSTDLGHENLDYARLPLNGSDHVSIIETHKAD